MSATGPGGKLRRLFAPRHLAVIGGNEAEECIRQNKKIGFTGEIWPVNPSRESLCGVPCFKTLDDLPAAPDAAFIAIPREPSVEAVATLSRMGAGGAVCYASGFAEVEDGGDLEQRLIEAAGDMPVQGPNCYGTLNYLDRVALWPDQQGGEPCERGAAFITQSGNIGITLTMHGRGLPISYLISMGNQAVMSISDAIDALADDPRVTGIGLYFEAVDDLPRFSEVLLKCARRRLPVVAVKAGRTETAVRIAEGHTSSLAGSDDLYNAFFRRYGLARVDNLPDLIETLKLIHVAGSVAGTRIATMSCSGGDAAMISDIGIPMGFTFPPLPPETEKTLEDVLGDRVVVANPLDYHTYIWGDQKKLNRCFEAMLGGGYDAVLLILDYPRPGVCEIINWDYTTDAMIDAVRDTGALGIIVATLPEAFPVDAIKNLLDHGVAPMQGVPECLRALLHASWLSEFWDDVGRAAPPPPSGQPPERDDTHTRQLSEHEAKLLLAGTGVRIPHGCVVPISKAADAATEVGFPITVKTAASLAHKTEAGGVALALADAGSVMAAAESMTHLGDRVLVEEMMPEPLVELIVGAHMDPQFGPGLVIGAGGVLVELLGDTVPLLLPTTEDEIRAALASLRVAPILKGVRGGPPADLGALVEAIMAIGRFAVERSGDLVEMDVNPLMVYAEGRGVAMADAAIRLLADGEQ